MKTCVVLCSLRALVKERLTAAAEEIFELFERTIAEYEEEVSRLKQRNIQNEETPEPRVNLHKTGVQTEHPHIKEEPMCIKQEEEQLQELPFTPVCVKTEDYEDKGQLKGADTEDQLKEGDSEENTDNSDDWTQEPASSKPSDTAVNIEVLKPHQCSECGMRFQRKDHLQGHVITHTGERPFSCSVCDKTFIRPNHLKVHMRNHTGERPYSCPFCHRGFTTKALLTPHMRIHTGDRPFSCSVCDKGFRQRSHLKAHVKTHTRERTFSCSVCKQSFSERGDLMVHSRAAHAQELKPRETTP